MAMILTIDPSEDLSKVVKRLKKAKVRVASVLESLHIVTVDADDSALAGFRAMPGVIAAEADAVVRLDPREVPDMGKPKPGRADQVAVPQVVGASWRSPAWDKGEP